VVRESRLVELFLSLLAFNAPARQEKPIVEYTKKLLEAEGFEVSEDQAGAAIGGNANNLIVRLPATDPTAPTVFLSAHFDTVEPTEGLVVSEVDGVFKSAGETILGADDRCGVAAAIESIRCLRDSGESYGNVFLLLSVAEEIGLLGAKQMPIEDLNLDFGFVLDTGPPVGSFVTRAAWHDRLELTVHGRPAHAGKEPELGVDAISVAAEAISRMRLGRLGPETTANVGVISGGTATNVVPAKVTVTAEARSTNVTELDSQIDHMIQCFVAAAEPRGAFISAVHHRHYSGYEVQPDSQVVSVATAAARQLGLVPAQRVTLGGSDGNVYNDQGVPCVVLGTGMDHIHTHNEQITRQDLILTAKMALECLLQSARVR